MGFSPKSNICMFKTDNPMKKSLQSHSSIVACSEDSFVNNMQPGNHQSRGSSNQPSPLNTSLKIPNQISSLSGEPTTTTTALQDHPYKNYQLPQTVIHEVQNSESLDSQSLKGLL